MISPFCLQLLVLLRADLHLDAVVVRGPCLHRRAVNRDDDRKPAARGRRRIGDIAGARGFTVRSAERCEPPRPRV